MNEKEKNENAGLEQDIAFAKGDHVIMELPNGYTRDYWFDQILSDTMTRCATAPNGKYFTNVAINLLRKA